MKIENLSAIEKVELAQRIWDSVAAEQDSIELSKEQAQLLNDRIKSFEADQDFGSSWSDVKSRISVESALINIIENPEIYQKVYRDFRRVLIGHFPFGVFYKMFGNKVLVFAVMHTSRAPRTWQKRS